MGKHIYIEKRLLNDLLSLAKDNRQRLILKFSKSKAVQKELDKDLTKVVSLIDEVEEIIYDSTKT